MEAKPGLLSMKTDSDIPVLYLQTSGSGFF